MTLRPPHRGIVHGVQGALVATETRIVGFAVVPVPNDGFAEKHLLLARDVGALEQRSLVYRE